MSKLARVMVSVGLVTVHLVLVNTTSARAEEVSAPPPRVAQGTGVVDKERLPMTLRLCRANLLQISAAMEMFQSDKKALPRSLKELVGPYLRSMPECPAARQDTYTASYRRHGTSYMVYCTGHHHQAAGVPGNYPCVTPERGVEIGPGRQLSKDRSQSQTYRAVDDATRGMECYHRKDYRNARIHLNRAISSGKLPEGMTRSCRDTLERMKREGH